VIVSSAFTRLSSAVRCPFGYANGARCQQWNPSAVAPPRAI